MPIIGIISDIHGDHVALDAALAHIRRLGAETILCAGDMIDGEPFAEEVITRLRAEKVVCIRGNHERWRLDGFSAEALAFGGGEELTREAMGWIRALPSSKEIEIAGTRVAMIHGDTENITAETQTERLTGLLAHLCADVLVVGHTHDAFEIRIGETLVVNPGACCRLGQVFVRKEEGRRRPRSKRPRAPGIWLPAGPRRASFATLALPARELTVYQIESDGGATKAAIYRRVED